jgi:hypothetical protein
VRKTEPLILIVVAALGAGLVVAAAGIALILASPGIG